jgi:hypothetical protein
MKVEKKPKILLYSWLPAGTYHTNLAIFLKKILQNLANLGHFFIHEKPTLCTI